MDFNKIIWGTPIPSDNRKEDAVIKQIKHYVEKKLKNALYEKNWGGGVFEESGVPDIYIHYKGKLFCVEAKRPNGKNQPTPLQVYQLEKRIKTGDIGIVAFTLEDVRKVIEEYERRIQNYEKL